MPKMNRKDVSEGGARTVESGAGESKLFRGLREKSGSREFTLTQRRPEEGNVEFNVVEHPYEGVVGSASKPRAKGKDIELYNNKEWRLRKTSNEKDWD